MSGVTKHIRLATFACREDGQSLILAMIVLLVLTIGTTAVVTGVMSGQSASTRDRQGARALNAAEAGLDLAANAVTASNGSPPSGVQSTTVDGVSVLWKATQVSSSSTGAVWNVDVRATQGKTAKVLQEQVVSTVHPGHTWELRPRSTTTGSNGRSEPSRQLRDGPHLELVRQLDHERR